MLEKRLGSLPVIADFSRRLDIAGIIDGLCPMRDVAPATHGQVIEVMIANRLTNPSAMVGICDWARAWAVGEVYGIAASALGDDRLGRALETYQRPQKTHRCRYVGPAPRRDHHGGVHPGLRRRQDRA